MLPTDTEFEAQVSMETEAVPVPEDPPFHVLFSGDFSGRQNLARTVTDPLPVRGPIEIDRDNFDEVMRKLNVGLVLEPGGKGNGAVRLRFSSLDDFHPDEIFRKISVFRELRELRKRLLDPEKYDLAAREVRGWFDENVSEEPEDEKEQSSPERIRDVDGGGLLEDIMGHAKRDASSYAEEHTERTDLGNLVRELVRPHLVTTDEVEQARLVSAVDETTSDLMRGIVHDSEFRSLEAAWRGLYLVVRRVETASDLKFFLLDLGKDELAEDLKSASDLSESKFFSLVNGSGRDAEGPQWALICGVYDLGLNVGDSATLMRVAKIVGFSRAPFIAHVRPDMLGIRSFDAAPTPDKWNLTEDTESARLWTALRTMPEAVNIGLAAPRFLARLPYGSETDPTEAFEFEELTEEGKHDQYLWANPSFLCGLILANSFRAHGWEVSDRYPLDVEGLPTHIYKEDGEARTKPCGEIAMTHEACDVLIEQGLMPVISYKNTDRVRVGGIHSIAFPAKALNGRWT